MAAGPTSDQAAIKGENPAQLSSTYLQKMNLKIRVMKWIWMRHQVSRSHHLQVQVLIVFRIV